MTVAPDTVFVGIPSHDRRIDVHCMLGLMKCIPHFGRTYFHLGMSDISLARNEIVHVFLQTGMQWLMWVDSDIVFQVDDWNLLWEGDEDIVTAEYARKIPGLKPAAYGLGFTRVHRSVFVAIEDLHNEDTVTETAQRYYMGGAMKVNFHPCGASGDNRWLGEDRGFFTLAAMAGCTHRLETRTRLKHVGHIEFGYPNQMEVFDNGAN